MQRRKTSFCVTEVTYSDSVAITRSDRPYMVSGLDRFTRGERYGCGTCRSKHIWYRLSRIRIFDIKPSNALLLHLLNNTVVTDTYKLVFMTAI